METKQIPLNELHFAEGEDRLRVWGHDEGITDLAHNIRRYGLLVPLLVKWTDKYIVMDGNRRLEALHSMTNGAGDDPHRPITCVVAQGDELELGAVLSTNVMRQALNPMDEYDVYSRLVVVGEAPKKIAKIFGKSTQEIRQVLALAGLHPAIKEDLRKDKISWEAAQALTILSDKEQQLKVFKECGDSSWRIRQALILTKPLIMYALFPQEEYEKAGGTYLVDLFEDPNMAEKACADVELYWKLQFEKIDAKVSEFLKEGWHSVIKVQRVEIKKDWIKRGIVKSKKERKKYNLYYTVDPKGLFSVEAMVEPTGEKRKEVKEALKETLKNVKGGEAATEDAAAAAEAEGVGRPFRRQLAEALREVRGRMVKEALTRNTNLSLKLLVWCLIRCNADAQKQVPAQIAWNDHIDEDGENVGPAFKQLFDLQVRCADMSPSELWIYIDNSGMSELETLLGHFMACAFDPQTPCSFPIAQLILHRENVSPRTKWEPDEDFWSQAGKAYMLHTLETVIDPKVAQRMAREKASDLARRMARWFDKPWELRWLDFNGKDEPLPDGIKKAIASWAPAILSRNESPDFDPVKALDMMYDRDRIDEFEEEDAEPEPGDSEGAADDGL